MNNQCENGAVIALPRPILEPIRLHIRELGCRLNMIYVSEIGGEGSPDAYWLHSDKALSSRDRQ